MSLALKVHAPLEDFAAEAGLQNPCSCIGRMQSIGVIFGYILGLYGGIEKIKWKLLYYMENKMETTIPLSGIYYLSTESIGGASTACYLQHTGPGPLESRVAAVLRCGMQILQGCDGRA